MFPKYNEIEHLSQKGIELYCCDGSVLSKTLIKNGGQCLDCMV